MSNRRNKTGNNASKKILGVVASFCYLLMANIGASNAQPLSGKALADFFAYKEGDIYVGVHPNKAKVVMVEYGALSCYHCKHFFLDVIPEIKSRFVEKRGLPLSIIYRNFVGDGPSLVAVTLLRCLNVNKDKAHRIIANLYKSQSDWAYSADSYKKLQEIFIAHGYNRYDVNKCAQDTNTSRSIMEEQREVVEKGGLTGTPMVIINGKPLVDVRPSSVLSQIELAFQGANKATGANTK